MSTLSAINRFLRDSATYLGVAVSRTRWFAVFLPLRRLLARSGGSPSLVLPSRTRGHR